MYPDKRQKKMNTTSQADFVLWTNVCAQYACPNNNNKFMLQLNKKNVLFPCIILFHRLQFQRAWY